MTRPGTGELWRGKNPLAGPLLLTAWRKARHAFQRDTLLELQDELQRLARATTRILPARRENRQRKRQALSATRRTQRRRIQIFTAVRRLWVRVLDPELRKTIEGFVDVCSRASLPTSGGDKDEILARLRRQQARVAESYSAVNDLLGERLRRELDRRSLAGESLQGAEGHKPQPH